MSQTVNRLYDSLDRANQATHELRSNRFDHFSVVYVTGRESAMNGGGRSGADAIADALMKKAHVAKGHARLLAPGILRGGTLVTVHAPCGMARAAIAILDGFDPIDSGLADFSDPPAPWEDAAPRSSALGWRVLLDDSDTFSRFWNIPALSKGVATTGSALGIAELSDSSGPFKGTFGGLPLLSDKAAWLSSEMGLPVLTGSRKG